MEPLPPAGWATDLPRAHDCPSICIVRRQSIIIVHPVFCTSALQGNLLLAWLHGSMQSPWLGAGWTTPACRTKGPTPSTCISLTGAGPWALPDSRTRLRAPSQELLTHPNLAAPPETASTVLLRFLASFQRHRPYSTRTYHDCTRHRHSTGTAFCSVRPFPLARIWRIYENVA